MYRTASLLFTAFSITALTACTYEVAFNPDYVPDERPMFIADGALLVVMDAEQADFTYEGSPNSRRGDFTTLTVPMANIVREIATTVFSSCFGQGVIFASDRTDAGEHVLALEGNLEDFTYQYTEIIDRGFAGQEPDIWIVPELQISFDVRVFDRNGLQVLDKIYDSGLVAGEGYFVTSRPSERINSVLHDTLHSMMLEVSNDLYPLLVGECTVIDLDA